MAIGRDAGAHHTRLRAHLEHRHELVDGPVEGVEQAVQEGIKHLPVFQACLLQQPPEFQRGALYLFRRRLRQDGPTGQVASGHTARCCTIEVQE